MPSDDFRIKLSAGNRAGAPQRFHTVSSVSNDLNQK
jgi:hypothetical protein